MTTGTRGARNAYMKRALPALLAVAAASGTAFLGLRSCQDATPKAVAESAATISATPPPSPPTPAPEPTRSRLPAVPDNDLELPNRPPTTDATKRPTVPETVEVPATRMISLAEARASLDRRGFEYRIRYETDATQPPGVVLDSEPPEGMEVLPGTVVTLVVARPPETESPSPPSGGYG